MLSDKNFVILLVDDDVANLKFAARYLSTHGFEVLTARNGEDGLTRAQKGQPDLILLDIQMPDMDGFEVCRQLKANPRTTSIPIIFMTALVDTADKVRGLTAGAVDYITKPIAATELLARVSIHLALRDMQKQLEEKNKALTAVNNELAAANVKIKALSEQQRRLFQRFTSKEVAEELIEHGFSLGGKHVQATAMFSDIRSFTTITESQPPATVIELLNDYFSYMIDAISSEGGIVNQMVGDGLMAIFGAPVPHPDHPQRAVRAALKMMACIEEFNQAQMQANKTTIRMGIGIATGQMIAGYLGTKIRATYTCVGDAVNIAARLEAYTKQVKRPILINGRTRRSLGDHLLVEEHGLVKLKGKTEDVQVFSVPVPQQF